jgi:exonuclease VII large subunit
MIRILVLLGVAALVSLGVACGDDDDSASSPTSATTTLCADLDKLDSAVRELQSINQSSTVDELQQAQDDVSAAVDDVKSSAEKVANTRVDDLETAGANLNNTVSSLEGEQTIGSAQSEISAAVAGVSSARDQLNDAANCPATSPAATS